jgi:hypothetical protein
VTKEYLKLFVDALEDKFNNKASIESMVINATALAEREFDKAHPTRGLAEWVLDVKK